MNRRYRAFGLHLLASATALTAVLGCLYLGWYRWPGWYLTGAAHVTLILMGIDVVLGPLLTLIVANPRKPRRELVRDIAVIVAVQLLALSYGTLTLWKGRPLFYTFSNDRLEMVQASDLSAQELALARQQNPGFVPRWYSRPRWVWAPLPNDKDEALRIMTGAIFGATDVIQMPRYYRPWDDAAPAITANLKKLDDQKPFTREEKRALRSRLLARGLAPDAPDTLVMWGKERPLLAVFERDPVRLKALIRAD